jgi:DNA-binding NtrC family response regulator
VSWGRPTRSWRSTYLIRKAIAATEGRKAAAARCLGLSRQGLYKKIARYGMTDLIGSSGS